MTPILSQQPPFVRLTLLKIEKIKDLDELLENDKDG